MNKSILNSLPKNSDGHWLCPMRNGETATIVAICEQFEQPIIGFIKDGICQWCKNGNYWHTSQSSTFDLIPPAIAPGNNPAGLTVEQVGEGYRLLTKEEIESRRRNSVTDVEAWKGGKWSGGWIGDDFSNTYRIKIAPEPRPWDCPEDVPMPVCWVRHNSAKDSMIRLVSLIGVSGIYCLGPKEPLSWKELAENWTHSTDGKNWLPCHKREGAK